MPLGLNAREGGRYALSHKSGDLPGQLSTAFRRKARAVCVYFEVFTFDKPGFLAEEAGFFMLSPSSI
jgi:hypothetical protein